MTDPEPRPPKVSLALPDGQLRRRLLELLSGSSVDVEVLDADDIVEEVRDAEGDVVIVEPSQVEEDQLDALGDIARDPDEAGVAVIGEHDPGTRARLLAAGFSGVLSEQQPRDALVRAVASLAEAEGGVGGPEAGGSAASPSLADFLTRSPRMREFVELVRRVIPADTALLITGPTGAGKEHLARAIHAESPRSEGPFVDVNCAALPEQLLESELFGHRKGAFTGADRDRAGHFEAASGGSVFLDEIGEMPTHLQVKLLTVLQRYEVTPIGSAAPIRVDVRVIAATNRDLQRDVADGRFREDLYYRLNVVPLCVPSLRERPEDIPELVGRFIQHFRDTMPISAVAGISDAAVEALMGHEWPGNVRELINVVERAMLLSKGPQIEVSDLPPELSGGAAAPPSIATVDPTPAEWLETPIRDVRERAVERAETAYLRAVLTHTDGHLARTADIAGISARALYEKMRRYGLRKEDFKPKGSGS